MTVSRLNVLYRTYLVPVTECYDLPSLFRMFRKQYHSYPENLPDIRIGIRDVLREKKFIPWPLC